MSTLMEAAMVFLDNAHVELDDGLRLGDQVRIRDAAEKAWNAVVQATDHLMQAHGRIPLPGREAHRARRDFLEETGHPELAQKYTYFAERLHGDMFYGGAMLPAQRVRQYLEEVRDYLDRASKV